MRTHLSNTVTINLSAYDGATRRWQFKTVEGLRRWASEWLGDTYDVSFDGFVSGWGDQRFRVSGMPVSEVHRIVRGESEDDGWKRMPNPEAQADYEDMIDGRRYASPDVPSGADVYMDDNGEV
jgi:hypothetical protein